MALYREAGETVRLGREVFETGWPQDSLCHSYGSYRNAVVRSLPQVADEMGTSETMLRRHYHNPNPKVEGEGMVLTPSTCSDLFRFGGGFTPEHGAEDCGGSLIN
jgi:hypothetical protein